MGKQPIIEERHKAKTGWFSAVPAKKYHHFINGVPDCKTKIKGFNLYIEPYGKELIYTPAKYTGGCAKCLKSQNISANY